MTPKTRLSIIASLLVLSSVYAFLVSWNPAVARTVALGYIAVMLTVLVLIQCFKRPPHA